MKPAKTVDQMIDLMHERGLTITDESRLRDALMDCNYYRLSGYFRVFQIDPAHGDNRFREGTCDSAFLTPYTMDEQLRALILQGTARVEVTLRSRFAYLLANNGGAYTYRDPASYQSVYDRRGELLRDKLIGNMGKWIDMSNEVCVRHYKANGQSIPIWVAIEAFPFDTFSRMLSLHVDTVSLRSLYRSVGIRTKLRTASEIVHAIVYLRNLCSHHSRLWHREMVIAAPMTRDMDSMFPGFMHEQKSVASSLVALMYLVNQIDHGDDYSRELIGFIRRNRDYAAGIGHPLHWE